MIHLHTFAMIRESVFHCKKLEGVVILAKSRKAYMARTPKLGCDSFTHFNNVSMGRFSVMLMSW